MTCVNEANDTDADTLVTIEVTRIALRRNFESAVSSMQLPEDPVSDVRQTTQPRPR